MERLLLVALVLLLAYLVYLVFSPFLVSLAWGGVLTVMFYPVHRRIRARIRHPNRAALLSTLLLTLLIITPGLLVGVAFTHQALQVADRVKTEWEQGGLPFRQAWGVIPFERIFNWLSEHHVTEDDVREFVTKNVERIAGFIATQLGGLARNLLLFLGNLFVALFASFYLFRDGTRLLERLKV
jgi:predicted PurR-regulated permease PerM